MDKEKAVLLVEFSFVGGGLASFYPDHTIDYEKLVNYLEKKFNIKIHTKTIYMPKVEKQTKDHLAKLRDKLSHLGFCIKTKEALYGKDIRTGETTRKCNFDSKIIKDMTKLAQSSSGISYIILFASDIDYFEAIEEIHDLGMHVIVLGFRNTVSDIKLIADSFIDIDTIQNSIMMPRKVYEENGKIAAVPVKKIEEEKIEGYDEYSNWYR